MNIEIDYTPTPSDSYFVSVSLNDKEVISFDYTSKGERITKQILIRNERFPKDAKIDSEWDELVIENGVFIKKYHAVWHDMDKLDWVNDEVWETTKESSISVDVRDKILVLAQKISDFYEDAEKLKRYCSELEEILRPEIERFEGVSLK